jgi:predicted ABC-type exoprotein transport system permease subunit
MENHAQAALWVLAFGLTIAAVVLAWRRTRWVRGMVGVILAAAVFQILTFGQPSILAGILLIGLVAATLPWKKNLRPEAAQWILRNGSHVL